MKYFMKLLKRPARGVFGGAFLFFSSTSLAAAWNEVYSRTQASIPLVFSGGALCSGALIEKDLVLTAAHCVNRFRPVHISWADDPKKTEPARILALDEKSDVALLELATPSSRPPLHLLPRGQKLPVGSAIATVGHPSIAKPFDNPPFDSEMTYLISTGVVSRWNEEDFISDMSVSPGNSGGPVLSDEGLVVGVVSRKRVDRFVGAIGLSASLTKVHEMLEKRIQKKLTPLSLAQAKSRMSMLLAYSSFRFLQKNENPALWYGGVVFDILDRVRFEFSDNLSETRLYRNYAFGYKFAAELENHNLVYLTPSLDWVHYRFIDPHGPTRTTSVDHKSYGLGLHLAASSYPLAAKFVVFRAGAHTYSSGALQLLF